MRRIWVGMLGLALIAPVLVASNQPKDGKASGQGKTPAEQFSQLAKTFHERMTELRIQFDTAKSEEDKAKVREKAFKEMPAEYGEKMMALATAHAKEPVALDILIWVCTQLSQAPQVPQALDALLREHAKSDRLALVCRELVTRDDGDQLLRKVRDKVDNKVVHALSGYCLALAMHDKDEPTPDQERESEKLLAEFLEKSKTLDSVPHPLVKAAEGLFWEVQNLGIGKTVPDAEAEDTSGRPVKLSQHKGKVVILDFWATWCLECRTMIPQERDIVKKYAEKPFVLISVSADEKKETLKSFLGKESMPWVHWWCGEQGLVEKWNIRQYPTIYAIDAKGVIRAKLVGPNSEKRLAGVVEKLIQEAS